jgi:formylglycine-generating enzyme required for sulfatase activity
VRGGSWNNNPQRVRSAYRDNNTADRRNNNQGFRLANSPAESRAAPAKA